VIKVFDIMDRNS